MSSKLMDTEPGGEQTQYEGINTFQKPHSKQGGQLSSPSTDVANSKQDLDSEAAAKGEQKAANMRYGQAISEEGVGGFTDPARNSGEVDQDAKGETPAQSRREQGYYGSNEVKRDVGA